MGLFDSHVRLSEYRELADNVLSRLDRLEDYMRGASNEAGRVENAMVGKLASIKQRLEVLERWAAKFENR